MFENMTQKMKIVLSAVGVSAIIIPALLLILASARTKEIPQVSDSKRPIDAKRVEEVVKKNIASPMLFSSTPSASPAFEGSPPPTQ